MISLLNLSCIASPTIRLRSYTNALTVVQVNSFLTYFLRNSVRLAIRKVMYAPSKPGEQPSVEVSKEFMMSPSKLHLECSLDKEVSAKDTA